MNNSRPSENESARQDDLAEASIGINNRSTSPVVNDDGIPGMDTGALINAVVGKRGFDPQSEGKYWSENHASETFAVGEPYESYEYAYQAGYEGYHRFSPTKFEDAESDIRKEYEGQGSHLPWEKARNAARVAWERVHQHYPK